VVGEPGLPTGSCNSQTPRSKLPPGATEVFSPLPPPLPDGVVHSWLEPPVQLHIWSWVPLAEEWPVASRHLPEPVLTSSPLLTVHFWALVPLQS
jgi:hypothetical protein